VSFISDMCDMHSIQLYVIKFISGGGAFFRYFSILHPYFFLKLIWNSYIGQSSLFKHCWPLPFKAVQCFLICDGVKWRKLGIFINSALAYLSGMIPWFWWAFYKIQLQDIKHMEDLRYIYHFTYGMSTVYLSFYIRNVYSISTILHKECLQYIYHFT